MVTIERTQALITVDDVAARCNISVSTVRRLIARGDLPTLRVGGQFRFDPADFEAWLLGQRQQGAADTPETDDRRAAV